MLFNTALLAVDYGLSTLGGGPTFPINQTDQVEETENSPTPKEVGSLQRSLPSNDIRVVCDRLPPKEEDEKSKRVFQNIKG